MDLHISDIPGHSTGWCRLLNLLHNPVLPDWRLLAWNRDRRELRHGIFYATSVGNFMVDGLDVDDDSLDSSETTEREAGEGVGSWRLC